MAIETGNQIGAVSKEPVNGVHSDNGKSAILLDHAATVALNATFYKGRSLGMVRVDLARRGIDPAYHEIILGAVVDAREGIALAQKDSSNLSKSE